MKEKEKGKGHPFAGILHDDEEILWMHGTFASTSLFVSKIYVWLTVLSWSILAISGIQRGDLYFLCGLSISFFLFFVVFGSAVFSLDEHFQASIGGSYALTNKRLLWWVKNGITEIAVESVPPIRLLASFGSRGTLKFGKNILPMTNIDDATYVKTMIEQAQKRRLEEEH